MAGELSASSFFLTFHQCDEKLPQCTACSRRSVPCIRSANKPENTTGISSSASDSTPETLISTLGFDILTPSISTSPPKFDVDVFTLQIFHHFERFTVPTLALGSTDLWQFTITLALSHRYLLHALLSLAAAHLNFLHPEDHRYEEAELHWQSAALSGFREALDGEITVENNDAIFACSVLLYHHSWTRVDENDLGITIEWPSGPSDVIPLAKSLRNVVLETIIRRRGTWREAMLADVRTNSARSTFITRAGPTGIMEELRKKFEEQYFLIVPEDSECKSSRFGTFMAECERIIPVIAVLKLRDRGDDMTSCEQNIVKYLFSWPVTVSDRLLEMIKQRDPLGLLLMHYFFDTMRRANIDRMWWSRKRMDFILRRVSRDFNNSRLPVVDIYSD